MIDLVLRVIEIIKGNGYYLTGVLIALASCIFAFRKWERPWPKITLLVLTVVILVLLIYNIHADWNIPANLG
jgi:hypothetical protein